MVTDFNPQSLRSLPRPEITNNKTNNGNLTIIAGSDLFHGPALISLQIATRITGMVYFTSPDEHLHEFAYHLKSSLASFIWVPFTQINEYIQKSDAILIGPGLKRFDSEKNHPDKNNNPNLDAQGQQTKQLSEELLTTHQNKQWIIDAGSLQTINHRAIPPNAIITPNKREFSMLFNENIESLNLEQRISIIQATAANHNCVIVSKGAPTITSSPTDTISIAGGPPGLSKGGNGDCLAALTASLACFCDPLTAGSSADYIVKQTAWQLYKQVGPYYSSDDLAHQIPTTLFKHIN